MFTVIVPNSVKKDIKKLDKPVISKIAACLLFSVLYTVVAYFTPHIRDTALGYLHTFLQLPV